MLMIDFIIVFGLLAITVMYRGIEQILCDIGSFCDVIQDKYNKMKGKK